MVDRVRQTGTDIVRNLTAGLGAFFLPDPADESRALPESYIREAVPAMKRAGRGVILNFSSGASRAGLPLRTPYLASKYAAEGLTRNLARELGPHNIRVNALLPGMIDNERMHGIVRGSAAAQGESMEDLEGEYLRYISMCTKIPPRRSLTWYCFSPLPPPVTSPVNWSASTAI